MKEIPLGDILITSPSPISIHENALSGIDTGETNGGFEVNIFGNGGAQCMTRRSVMFRDVRMQTDHPDYTHAPIESLRHEAKEMLIRDYIKGRV